ncbi:hypothetical protein [Photorhabdus asymbiotica]
MSGEQGDSPAGYSERTAGLTVEKWRVLSSECPAAVIPLVKQERV